ncbi:MAG: YdcF family protein [Spirochaetia bacterium]
MKSKNSASTIRVPARILVRRLGLLPLLSFCSVVCFFIVNLLLIFPWSPAALVEADRLLPADLIVFLGGAFNERVDYAFSLAGTGYGRLLYTPNPGDFFAGNGASSTFEEALNTRDFVRKHSIRSILLVTSPYHSLRAAWIFRKVMPGIAVVSAPCCLEGKSLQKKLEYYYPREIKKLLFYFLLYSWRNFPPL